MIRKGIVVNYLLDKTFGFIRYAEDKENVFFHRSDYEGSIPKVGQHVEFTLIEDFKGRLKAVKVKPIAGATMPWSEDPRKARARYQTDTPRAAKVLAERESQLDFFGPSDGAQ